MENGVSFQKQMFANSTISPGIAGRIRIFFAIIVRRRRKVLLNGKIMFRLKIFDTQCRIEVVALIHPIHIKFQRQRQVQDGFERSLPGIDNSRRVQNFRF